MPVLNILDGGLGTWLHCKGVLKSTDCLWAAGCLISTEGRQHLREAHVDFLRAGADIIKTASYQISIDLLRSANVHEGEYLNLIRQSVDIGREACHQFWLQSGGQEKSLRKKPKLAGSVGPYGACLADGSEYNGNYVNCMTKEDLIQWHTPRILALIEAGIDYLAIETFPALIEAEAVLQVLHQHAPQQAAWISFSCKDGHHLCHGEEWAKAASTIWQNKTDGLVAVGINCTNPNNIDSLLKSLKSMEHSQLVPLVLYPNSGEDWDSELKRYDGQGSPIHQLAKQWIDAYGNIYGLGGCCRCHPQDIALLRQAI